MITLCSYCQPNSAGQHEPGCPNNKPAPSPGIHYFLEPVKEVGIKEARMVIWQALQNDPGLKLGYVSNIAMLIYDRLDGVEYEKRNSLANEILELLFRPEAGSQNEAGR